MKILNINFKAVRGKTSCTYLWVINSTNQVSSSSGFQAPHMRTVDFSHSVIHIIIQDPKLPINSHQGSHCTGGTPVLYLSTASASVDLSSS